MTLTNSLYPPAPQILNFGTLTNVNPAARLTLAWDPIAGGSASDYIVLPVLDRNEQAVFSPLWCISWFTCLPPRSAEGVANTDHHQCADKCQF